jgi:release factor glutamine methyltransferase
MRLRVIPGVHRPLSDTRLLASAMMEIGVKGAAVADLCTGSGAIAIAACDGGARHVVAIDVSRRAVLTTRFNAHANGCRVSVRRGDLLRGLGNQRFDLIVSNPPYIPSVSDRLPRHTHAAALDAGKDGRALIDKICREASRHLLPGGSVLIVHSSICDEQATLDLLASQGLRATAIARRRGPLGPVLRSRAAMLRERGLLGDIDEEDLLVIRGQANARRSGPAARNPSAWSPSSAAPATSADGIA